MNSDEPQSSGEPTGPALMLETEFGSLMFRSSSSDSICSDVTILSSSDSETGEWCYGNIRGAGGGVVEEEWWEKDTDGWMKSQEGRGGIGLAAESKGDLREVSASDGSCVSEGDDQEENDGREELHRGGVSDEGHAEGPFEGPSDLALDFPGGHRPDGLAFSPASPCKAALASQSGTDANLSEIQLATPAYVPNLDETDQEQPDGPASGRIERSSESSESGDKSSSDQESFASSSTDDGVPCNCCPITGLSVHDRGCANWNDFYWSILQWGTRKRRLSRNPKEYVRLLREASAHVGSIRTKSGSFLFQLARLIEQGVGEVPKNISIAIFLYCEAIRQESREALVYLARLAEFGTKNIRLSVSRARNLYRRIARLNGMGSLYAKAYLVNGSPASLGMFRKASRQGDAHALLNVADYFFYDNTRPPRSAFIARDLYAEVVRLRHCSFCFKEALFSTAYIMEDEREDVQQDVQESVRLYESLIAQGHTESFYRLGLIFHYGKDAIERNETEAVRLYKVATRRSHFPDPPYRLGRIYQQGGRGVPQDLVAAEHYFSTAGKRGRGKAYYILGEMFQFGTFGCSLDGRKAEKYYRLALEHDYVKARYNLACLLSVGYKGASKDMEKAIQLCREGAESGCAGSLRLLGDSIMNGVADASQNLREAYSLLRRSAEAGDQYALVSLAFYHVGVPEIDREQALPINGLESERLFRIGMGNRLADAAYGLGYLHEVGFGENGTVSNVSRSLHSIRSRIEIGDETGQSAFEKITNGPIRDGEECVQFYRIAGRREHDRSLYRLALVMNNHDDIPRNPVQMVRLLRMAVDAGNVNAPYVLGQILKQGDEGVARDAAEAAAIFRTGVARGDTNAAYELGVMLEEGDDGVAQDFEEALAMYQKAMEGGNVLAMVTLGDIYKVGGAGVSADMDRAVELYRLAADKGDVDAMIELATLNRSGAHGVSVNREEARTYYKMAYSHGHTFSMFSLADLEEEDGNAKEACKHYEVAYKDGILEAALRLSYLLLDGEDGVEEDAPRAVELLRSCIRDGMVSSQITLGNVLESGAKGVRKNPVEAAALYQAAIEDGVVDAYMFLGKLKERGDDGVPKDPVGAVYCYRRGIEHGSPSSAYWLANLLERGDEGVKRDVAEALTLYNDAAEQGHESAMHRLGEIWENGLYGVQKNKAKALELYTEAVNAGNFDSLCNLGFLLLRGGDGVEKDRERGEHYLRQAAVEGSLRARKYLRRRKLGRFLTVGLIATLCVQITRSLGALRG